MPVGADTLLHKLETFPWKTWGDKFGDGYEPLARDLVQTAGEMGADRVDADPFSVDDPFVSEFMSDYVGERIVQLNDVTRDRVSTLVRNVFANGGQQTPFELGNKVLDVVREQFDGYSKWRADRIARTEGAILNNIGNILGYKGGGVETVTVEDGDDDEECAAANGQEWTLEEALSDPLAHPNCTRNFEPNVADTGAAGDEDESEDVERIAA
jgi:hypothetical protein